VRQSLEERACDLAVYIIENRTTVRAAAKKFGVSKSTVHTDKTIWNGSCGWYHKRKTRYSGERKMAGAAAPAIAIIRYTLDKTLTVLERKNTYGQ